MRTGWRRLAVSKKYSSEFLSVLEEKVLTENGRVITHVTLVIPDVAIVVPFLGVDTIVMLHSYRYAADETLLEFPAGHLEKGEKPMECARRELEEETGYRAKRMELLGKFFPSARSKQTGYVYVAHDLRKVRTKRDDTEVQRVALIKSSRALDHMGKGRIKHGASLAALAMLCRSARWSKPLLAAARVSQAPNLESGTRPVTTHQGSTANPETKP